MKFRQFIESDSDKIHPLQKWHQEYQFVRNQELRNRTYRIGIRPSLPSDNLAKQINTPYVALVAELKGSSVGRYGYGDVEEMPAKSPFLNAAWEFFIDAEQENTLRGLTAFIVDKSGGSYHEKWATLLFYVIISESLIDERLKIYKIDSSYAKYISKFFKFEGLRSLVDMMEKDHPDIPHPNKSGESRDAYWKRLLGDLKSSDPTGYDPNDNYWKK